MVSYLVYYNILLQNPTNIIRKYDSYFITKCDKKIITKCGSFITKCKSNYKMRRLIQNPSVHTAILFIFLVNIMCNTSESLLKFKYHFLIFQAVFVILEFDFSLSYTFFCILCFRINMTIICKVKYTFQVLELYSIILLPSSSFIGPITFLFLLFGSGLPTSHPEVSNLASTSCAMSP